MTGTELDEILAEPATPENQEQATQETTTDVNQEAGQARDENGRFAAKAETTGEAAGQETDEDHGAEDGKVPQQALHASRQKAREAAQEAETLKQQIAELRGQVQMLSTRPQQPLTPKEEAKAPDFWEDPTAFVQGALTPVQQQMQQQREQFSKMLAVQAHGKETVDAAYQALGSQLQSGNPAAQAEYQTIMKSEHPFDALVGWHKRQQTLQMVGNDPNAWLEAELEKRLADPAQQAKIIERLKAVAAANTDRSNPVTNLPPSLSRLPAGGNTAQDNDTSDAALFSFATR